MKQIVIICMLFIASLNAQDSYMLLLTDDAVEINPLEMGSLFQWLSYATPSSVTKDANDKVTSIADLSGNNNNMGQADTSKSPTYDAVNGFLFDGTDDFIEATLSDLDLGTSDWAFEWWLNPTDPGVDTHSLYTRYQTNGNRIRTHMFGDDITLLFNEGVTPNTSSSTSNPFADDALHHIVVVYDNSTELIVYVDGVVLTLSSYNFDAGVNFTITGTDIWGSDKGIVSFFDGYFLVQRFWKRILTPLEVISLFEYGAR